MRKVLIGAAILVVLVVVVILRISAQGRKAPVQGIAEIQAAEGVPVDAVTVRADTLTVTREVSGQAAGWRQTDLTARADHKVAEVDVREGERVKPGQRILRYDTRTSPEAVARLEQAQASYDNAKRQVDRLQPLFDQGAISESDLDNARTQLTVAAATLRDARLQVEEVSPIEGIVTLVAVTPGATVAQGETVAQVATLDSVRVTAEVASDVARAVAPGAPVRVLTADTGGGTRETGTGLAAPAAPAGRVSRVSLGADPQSRLYEIEAVFPNPDRNLLPGQFVTLSVVTGHVDAGAVAPRAALLGEQEVVPGSDQEVFAVRDGKAERIRVRLGAVTEDRVQVTSGLEPGDLVVTFGANKLHTGDKVRFHKLDGELRPGAEGSAS